jgi:hypothetical protein
VALVLFVLIGGLVVGFYQVGFAILFLIYILFGIWRHYWGAKPVNNL